MESLPFVGHFAIYLITVTTFGATEIGSHLCRQMGDNTCSATSVELLDAGGLSSSHSSFLIVHDADYLMFLLDTAWIGICIMTRPLHGSHSPAQGYLFDDRGTKRGDLSSMLHASHSKDSLW